MKKFFQNEKGIKYALLFYLILVLADIVSTIMNWELIQYLEANPLYKYGGLPLITILNLVIIYLFYRIYDKTENINLRFYLLFILISVTTTRAIVVWNNIQIFLNPPTVEQVLVIPAQQMAQMKQQYRFELITLNIIPFLNGAITWILFRKDHEVNVWKKKKKTIKYYLKKILWN